MRQLKNIFRQFTRNFAGNFKPSNKIVASNTIFERVLAENHNRFDWEKIRCELVSSERHINKSNLDAIIIGLCTKERRLDAATSYLNYLESKKLEINDATIGKLIRLYHVLYQNQILNSDDEAKILKQCHLLMEKHPILDATTAENVIYGMCLTKEWQKSLELLDMIRYTSSVNSGTYSVIISKAFEEGCTDVGWNLLSKMTNEALAPRGQVYISWLKKYQSVDDTEKMLNFIGESSLIIPENVIEDFCSVLAPNYECNVVQINQSGDCPSCSNHLPHIQLNEAEFKKLSYAFLNDVLIRNDAFLKTNPSELEKFKSFVERTAPYNCVIDGLNVAYSHGTGKSPKIFADTLASVVKYFAGNGDHCLVIGRKHMARWPNNQMNFVRQNSSLFLTEDSSQDDPFMLYAALKSGPATNLCSRDLMRGHSHLLNPESKRLFRRWQQQHQYSVITTTEKGNVSIKEPIAFEIRTHKVKDHWHIPFSSDHIQLAHQSFELPPRWICLKIQNE